MSEPRTRPSLLTRTSNVAPTRAPSELPRPSRDAAPAIDTVEDASAILPGMRLLESPNFERALRVEKTLSELAARSPERIDPLVLGTLIRGVAEPRTNAARGQEGVLGAHQAIEAAQTLIVLDAETFGRVHRLLERADPTERALILKAVAANQETLLDPFTQEAAVASLERFAEWIHGTDRAELAKMTTAIDVDDDAQQDTLLQQFHTSCGPATAQILRAELDPIYARTLHEERPARLDPTTSIAAEQRAVLEKPRSENGAIETGAAVPRQIANDLTMLADELRAARDAGAISRAETAAIVAYAQGAELSPKEKRAFESGLAVLQDQNNGFPSREALAGIRSVRAEYGRGMSARPALLEIARLDYRERPIDLPVIEQRLRDGRDVPFAVSGENGAHFMLITDVRGEGEHARYLVSDAAHGNTEWVKKRDLLDGSFLEKQFNLPEYDRLKSFYQER